jgi:hypothetical protein
MDGWSGEANWEPSSGAIVNRGDGGSTWASFFAPVDLSQVQDYAIDADIKLLKYTSTVQASFGLVVRSNDAGEGYGGGHCAAAGIFSCANGSSTYNAILWTTENQYIPSVLRFGTFDPGKGNWHHYHLEARGTQITFTIDRHRSFRADDTRYTMGGQVGLWSENCQLVVRNVSITEF